MPTQHIRSKIPSTKDELQQVEARDDLGNGVYYCSVDAILQSLDIEPATAVLYLVDGKEAEFIHSDGHPDYKKLKFYSSKEIVVSVDPAGRSPRGSRQKANHSKTKPRPQSQNRNLAPVDNEDGNHNAPKDGKSRKYSMRHLTDKITKPQPVKVVFSEKTVEFKAHYSPPGGYHCHVSEIFATFKLDSTGSTIYKYTIEGNEEAEFKKDKHNRIDLTKKIKYCPGQVIEIRVAPSEISSAVSDLTMIHEERNPNRRRESNGADSQSTANEGHDHNPQAEPHVGISPQASGTQERPPTSPKCPCEKRALDAVNLLLTGAAMARKAFEPLAKLTSVSSLNVTLAWDFKKSDLSAVVKNLNEVAVEHLTLDLKDKKSWKRPKFMPPFGSKYQPLQDLYKNPHLKTFHLVGASRFGIRTNPLPGLSSTSLKCLHLRIRFGKRDQAAAENIIKNCPNLVDLRLGGIYKSEMHPTLKSTIGGLKHLEVLHFYGMQKNEFGGPILNLLGKVSLSGNKIKELVLVNSHMDAVETQTLITNCERTLTTIVLDHATFQPPNLKFLNTITSNKPLLQNLTCLHIHVYENAENVQLLSRVLGQLSLTHLGLTQDDPRAVQDLLGKSLLQNVKFGSLHSLFLSGFSGTSLDPLWEAVGRTTGSESNLGGPPAEGAASLKYLSLEQLSKCPDLSSQLRQIQLESLWIVADVKELACELNQLATSLDYSSLKKVALFRSGDQQGLSLKSYFGQLEGHLRSAKARAASNMTIRVGDFKKGSSGLSGLEMLSYVVDNGVVTPGPKESTCKKHNPRYHRYRWGMTGWSDGSGSGGGAGPSGEAGPSGLAGPSGGTQHV